MAESEPIACTLTTQEMSRRAAGLATLGAGLADVETDGARARLRFRALEADRAALDDFIAAESRCCPFFVFQVEQRDGELALSIEAPAEGTAITRALVAAFVAGWMLPS